MNAPVSLARVAGLIGDPARSDMLLALLTGQALTAGELSIIAGVSAQNASGHLQKLLEGRLVSIEAQGRHRYYRLSSPEVANALESLAAVSANRTFRRDELPQLAHIRFCRTCYDHMAGKVAVQITSSLVEKDFIQESGRDFMITAIGEDFFQSWGIGVRSLHAQRRRLARRCLDWTERKPHISGALGAAILQRCKDLRWIAPIRGSRAMRLTTLGEEKMSKQFGLAPLSKKS
jgi:DNA-binding transcriptional ArsR family regulator